MQARVGLGHNREHSWTPVNYALLPQVGGVLDRVPASPLQNNCWLATVMLPALLGFVLYFLPMWLSCGHGHELHNLIVTVELVYSTPNPRKQPAA